MQFAKLWVVVGCCCYCNVAAAQEAVPLAQMPVSEEAVELTGEADTIRTQADSSEPMQIRPRNSSAEGGDTIEEIVTVGRPIRSYMAIDALTGTKSNALLRDLPLSLSVVSQELIEDRSLIHLGEALDSVSGAQRKAGYGGTQNFGAILRGFDAGFLTLRNGLRDNGFYTQRDTSNIERFEVLKGPASILYGALGPGGITNTITKKPTDSAVGRLDTTIGSHEFYRVAGDLGGPLSGTISGRINAAYENANSFRDHVQSEGIFVAPVARWTGEKTSWTIEAEFKDSEYTWDLGLPTTPAISQVVLSLPRERFLGEPDGVNEVTSYYVNSLIEHSLTDHWQIRQNLSYSESEGEFLLRSAFQLDADGRTALRAGYHTDESSSDVTIQHELMGEFPALGVEHQFVAGIEYYEGKQFYNFIFQGIDPIDIFDPVYGSQPAFEFPLFGTDNSTKSLAVYAQDLISVSERFKLLFGLRFDRVAQENVDILAMQETLDRKRSSLSPQGGVVFQPTDRTSLYASYSSSFLPQTSSGVTAAGSTLKPEEGEQIEVGVKHNMFDDRAMLNVAVYTITKENVTMGDPENPLFVIQSGEQKSRGVEFDIGGSIAPGWDVIVTGSYIDAEVTRDERATHVGARLRGVPKWSGSVWTKYGFSEGPFSRLSLGVGAYYSSDRHVSIPNYNWTLPSHLRLDAMASYDIDRWSLQLNINNITDDDIYDVTATTIIPQEPRAFRFSIGYRFL